MRRKDNHQNDSAEKTVRDIGKATQPRPRAVAQLSFLNVCFRVPLVRYHLGKLRFYHRTTPARYLIPIIPGLAHRPHQVALH